MTLAKAIHPRAQLTCSSTRTCNSRRTCSSTRHYLAFPRKALSSKRRISDTECSMMKPLVFSIILRLLFIDHVISIIRYSVFFSQQTD
jgi:hypothetical protein